jgi:hypothetical protein
MRLDGERLTATGTSTPASRQQDELFLLQRGAQFADEADAVERAVVGDFAVGLDAGVSSARAAHGDVGAAQQRFARAAVGGGEGDADAGLDGDEETVERERLVERSAERPRLGGRGGIVVDAVEDDEELVVADVRE